MAATLTATLKPWSVPDRIFAVAKYHAIGDGITLNTTAIQKAIDACAAAGGGVVLIEAGDYLTGTLDLKSGVMLEIAKNARLLGSTNFADYPPRVPRHETVMDTWMKLTQSLIYAENCDRVGIRGEGIIDGRGSRENFPGKNDIGAMPNRPFLIRMVECRNVVMDGITLKNAASWMQNYLNCEDVILHGLRVENMSNWNNDAFDIDGCRNVIVRDCTSLSVDDGLCFKGAGLRTMENVLVENCEFLTPCNPIKFGTDSQGNFRNFVIRNVKIAGTPVPALHKSRTAISGISLQSVDGGTLENILITNVQMDETHSPFCLRLGDRGRVKPDMPKPPPGAIRRIILENIHGGRHELRGSIISGIPGAKIEDVIFRNIRLTVAGGGDEKDATREVPELINVYPDAFSFGKSVPAYGFWIRHATNIIFDKVAISTETPDARQDFVIGVDTSAIVVNRK
ncbi:MAG TPA: glycosyl hydrolase family 28 protein [Lacunisphaera sp.]